MDSCVAVLSAVYEARAGGWAEIPDPGSGARAAESPGVWELVRSRRSLK